MNKTWVSAFGFIILMFTAVVSADGFSLSVNPPTYHVAKEAGTVTFNVIVTLDPGEEFSAWDASSDRSWLRVPSVDTSGVYHGNGSGPIICSYDANTSTLSRTATIRITGAANSPVDVTVTQAPTPVLLVTPTTQNVTKDAGTTEFTVSSAVPGTTMPWTASVTLGASWLRLPIQVVGSSLKCEYDANTTTQSRTATIRITATNGATGSPVDVTVTQAPTLVQPVLSVIPAIQNVAKDAGTTEFSISNTGTGTMYWNAQITPASSWLRITSVANGSKPGTITCGYDANTTTLSRTATIRITASNSEEKAVTGSPVDVTVTQAPTPVLLVIPATQNVTKDAGTTKFSVSNTVTGTTMPWTASVTPASSWLRITSGASGSNSGTIICGYDANTTTSIRTATIRITATNGATGSPKDVTVTQAPTPVLLVIPATQNASKDAGTATFSVSNTVAGTTMPWTASVTPASSWLSITSGASGSNSGTIICSYSANTTTLVRTATIRITATNGATDSPKDVTVTQAPTPILSVSPTNSVVTKDAGTATLSVSNTVAGTTMPWTASVTPASSWLSITSGASGSNSGTIICSYSANATTSSRTATIRITATNGATDSPKDVTVTQAPTADIFVNPATQDVSKDAGTTTFSVSNTVLGTTMPWSASVTPASSWLSITSGASGSNSGTITCSYSANTTTLSRTATIRITATNGALGSPVDVTVTQAPTPVLSVSPATQDVTKDAGTTTFSVSNTVAGTIMPWTAAVTSDSSWLQIPPETSGSNSGTITCSYSANTTTSVRTATIRITATSGATGSPVDMTVTQAPTPVLSVNPATRDVSKDAGTTTFSVSNTVTGTIMPWTAAVTTASSWFSITSGASGSNSGTITCSYSANTTTSGRTATIRITATSGATGSPVDVTVTQAPTTVQPVTDTGQTKCYDVAGNVITCPSPGQALYGQDANTSINPMSYTKLDGSGNALPDSATSWVMVRDNVTGLIWENKQDFDGAKHYDNPQDADNTYTWYDSNPATNGGYAGTPSDGTDTEAFISALNSARFGGHSDWRLPTIKELDSIVNCDIPYPGPTINTTYFPNTQSSYYWSSTTHANDTKTAWSLGFVYGGVHGFGFEKSHDYYVRAVRGGQSQSVYKDNLNGTVTDTSTGLMWQQNTPGAKTWEDALSYCELPFAGFTDWRLPTKKELRSLVDYSRFGPAIDTKYFPDTVFSSLVPSFYWSSTTFAYYSYDAWAVDFFNGSDYNPNKYSHNYHVRAVRVALTACTATLDVNLLLHIPYLSYVNVETGTQTLWADLVYEFNPTYPTLIIFKLTNTGILNNPSFSCAASTLSGDLIHIPDVLLSDGITHLWVDLEYSSALSTDGNAYFIVTNYGILATS